MGAPLNEQGDHAYLLHIVRSLKNTGKGACILPHGVLFRGNAEAEIRRNLIRRGYIKGIIGLPANLFFGTGIPACIIVLDKQDAQERKGIFMIDASGGFMRDGPKNRLRAQDIHKIVDVFTRLADVPRFSRMVAVEEIEMNDFKLNLPRYVDRQTPKDRQHIDAHPRRHPGGGYRRAGCVLAGLPRSAGPAGLAWRIRAASSSTRAGPAAMGRCRAASSIPAQRATLAASREAAAPAREQERRGQPPMPALGRVHREVAGARAYRRCVQDCNAHA